MDRPPLGAPTPLPEHLALLDQAIRILESVDLLTKDSIPVVKEALSPLDELITILDNFDGHAYPGGFQGQLQQARFQLVTAEATTGLALLRDARAAVTAYWDEADWA